jgi:hypothetical protein
MKDFLFFASIVHSNFKSTKGKVGAYVSDEACDEEIPLATLVILFLKAPPLLQIVKKCIEWVMDFQF